MKDYTCGWLSVTYAKDAETVERLDPMMPDRQDCFLRAVARFFVGHDGEEDIADFVHHNIIQIEQSECRLLHSKLEPFGQFSLHVLDPIVKMMPTRLGLESNNTEEGLGLVSRGSCYYCEN